MMFVCNVLVKKIKDKIYMKVFVVNLDRRELDFKRFTIFKKDPNCHIINETKLL